ncbi:MAG: hypothetical protein KKD07_02215, partial [Candidatus Omnitrophica bacterium]|nr:hypothetical protein [Candidatus Omnitrophota bacterium]
HSFKIPELPDYMSWFLFVNTDAKSPNDICAPGKEKKNKNQSEFLVGPRSVVILTGKDNK